MMEQDVLKQILGNIYEVEGRLAGEHLEVSYDGLQLMRILEAVRSVVVDGHTYAVSTDPEVDEVRYHAQHEDLVLYEREDGGTDAGPFAEVVGNWMGEREKWFRNEFEGGEEECPSYVYLS
jgi:hypothetical protein